MGITEAQCVVAQGHPMGGRRGGETQLKDEYRADKVAYICKPNTQEAETTRLQVLGQPGVWGGVTASDLEKDLSPQENLSLPSLATIFRLEEFVVKIISFSKQGSTESSSKSHLNRPDSCV